MFLSIWKACTTNDIMYRKSGVVVNLLNCDIVGSEFQLQSCYYVHFRNNTLRKGKLQVKLATITNGDPKVPF